MRRLDGVFASFVVLLLVGTYAGSSAAQQSAPPAQASEPQSPQRPFTIDTIYSPPGLNGHLTRGIAWTPASKQFSFFSIIARSLPPFSAIHCPHRCYQGTVCWDLA